jgi:hypothetical protein
VKAVVITPRHQAQILDPVVGFVLVDVVNDLAALGLRVPGCNPHDEVLVGVSVRISERVAFPDAHLDVAG